MMGQRLVVTFPDIGEGVVEGEIVQWLKNEGEMLQQDEPVVVVMTDKATVELPAPRPGKLAKQHVQTGKMAIKDKPLYEIEVEGEVQEKPSAHESAHENPKVSLSEKKRSTIPKDERKVSSYDKGEAIAIPKVRHLAKELGLDLSQIQGRGKNGRVEMEDLRSASLQQPPQLLQLPDDAIEPLIGIKSLMAKKMAESKARIPHFSYFERVDVTRLVQLKQNVKHQAEEEGVHVTFMPFLIKALSLTIKTYPLLNCSYDQQANELRIHRQQNVGIAVSTPLGLIVPVLKAVEEMQISQIIQAYEDLMDRAHTSKLNRSDMHDATMTISNFGTNGHGMWATPIINYPEVAILAVARIQSQPVVKNGELAIADVMHLSWSFDHRVIDGDMAVRISDYFCQLLQNPAALI